MLGQQNVDWANMSMGPPNGPYGMPQLYYNGPKARGILWGPDRNLDFWAALRAGQVGEPERRAVSLLASMADERRLAYYLLSGLFPALGNATKRIYMVRRFHTVVELDDGVPVASWCILTKDRHRVPETDHVVAMKNLVEGEEMAFREVGNCFEPNRDPFVGNVPLKSEFTNPYVNSAIGSPRIRTQNEYRKTHDEQRTLREEATLRIDDARQHALGRADSVRYRALERARKWTPNAPKQKTYRKVKNLSSYESMLLRVRDQVARGFGIPVPPSETLLVPDNGFAVIQPDGTYL